MYHESKRGQEWGKENSKETEKKKRQSKTKVENDDWQIENFKKKKKYSKDGLR